MKSWLLNAVYFSQFGYCNPEITQFFKEKSRYQLLCHMGHRYSSKSIKPINIMISFVSHSAKRGTIAILTYLGKIAISLDCNIQIG